MNGDAAREKLALALQLAPDLPVLWPSSDKIVGALLPVVRDIAAEELREAAAAWSNKSLSAEYADDEAADFLRDRAAVLASPAPAPRPAGKVCRVVVDGDEAESFLVCLTCDPGAEVCCGHHLAPHDADGCHEMVARVECQCARRPAPAPRAEEGQR